MTRSHQPKRTHADLLTAATTAYAEHHAALRNVAQQAADELKRRHDSAQLVEATRQPEHRNDSTDTPTGR